LLRGSGSVAEEELYQVFNMGIGMIAVVKPSDAPKILASTKAYIIGTAVKGRRRVHLVKS
jgi:phosphoribosylformylglycinamidine cyclo-ligase